MPMITRRLGRARDARSPSSMPLASRQAPGRGAARRRHRRPHRCGVRPVEHAPRRRAARSGSSRDGSARLRARLRHGQPRVRRRHLARVDLPRGVDLQAVRRVLGGAARRRRQAVARRRGAQAPARDPGLRQADHRPAPDAPHQRPARPVDAAELRRLARGRRHHPGRRAADGRPPARPQLRPRCRVPVQQHRFTLLGGDRAAGLRSVAAGLRRGADLRRRSG